MSEDSDNRREDAAEFPDFVSIASDEDKPSDDSGRAFLRYKTKTKKNFKAPKLVGLSQQMIKVGKTLQDKKNRNLKEEKSDSLSTPSELIMAPSDFEHVFHKSTMQKERDLKEKERKEQERREQERREQELLFRIFRQCKLKDTIIPIYIVDEYSIPRIVNMPLSRLNQLNKSFFDSKSVVSKTIAVKTMPLKASTKSIKTIAAKSFPKKSVDQLLKEQIPKLKNIALKTIAQPKELKKLKKDVKK